MGLRLVITRQRVLNSVWKARKDPSVAFRPSDRLSYTAPRLENMVSPPFSGASSQRSIEARAGVGRKDWSECHCCAAFSVSERAPLLLILVTVNRSG